MAVGRSPQILGRRGDAHIGPAEGLGRELANRTVRAQCGQPRVPGLRGVQALLQDHRMLGQQHAAVLDDIGGLVLPLVVSPDDDLLARHFHHKTMPIALLQIGSRAPLHRGAGGPRAVGAGQQDEGVRVERTEIGPAHRDQHGLAAEPGEDVLLQIENERRDGERELAQLLTTGPEFLQVGGAPGAEGLADAGAERTEVQAESGFGGGGRKLLGSRVVEGSGADRGAGRRAR